MDLMPGCKLAARGLTWDVLAVDRVGDVSRISLRCVDGDMAGLEWEIFAPPDRIEAVSETFDPRHPVALSLWRTMHRAHLINQIPRGALLAARNPGRLRVEPFQLVPLLRALDMPRVRLLLADGVGLGKTIQAGLIVVELIVRRRAHRILIVVPSGPLLRQWEQEMRQRFSLRFNLITNAAELWAVRCRYELGTNPFEMVSLCIISLDFSKQDYVLDDLERSSWDLVIIDEAHHCVGLGPHASRENTYRRRLAEVLARRSDGLLLLTATPHDGHEPHFASLIALLDPSLVDDAGGFVGRAYRHHVIRRTKAHILDPNTGAPLFRGRQVIPVKVDVAGTEFELAREFHRSLSSFVVQRLRRGRTADDSLAFVSLLKRSVSTIASCLKTLSVVMDRLSRRELGEQESNRARRERLRSLRAWRRRTARYGTLSAVDEAGETALEIESMAESLRDQGGDELAKIIRVGMAAEAHDPKLMALALEVRLIRLRHERANILIYTEYHDSQLAALGHLRSSPGISGEILTIGGSDNEQARAKAAMRFAEEEKLILISTDSLAEGLNLHQHCFHLIHLDLPYNPNRLEQRNGRIDRYGQRHQPEIRYLYIPGTFEESLLLHLIAKYEKARASIDIMPDTLGVTAEPADYRASLTAGFSDRTDDLFRDSGAVIPTVDRAVRETDPKVIADLMREIDRAFDSFDLMAVSHGWYGFRGANQATNELIQAERTRFTDNDHDDLADFVQTVIETASHGPRGAGYEIEVPAQWRLGYDGLPGFDPATNRFRFSHDFENWCDATGQATGFLGLAHPLSLQALRHGICLGGAVSVSGADRLGLLLTYEIEIAVADRILLREVAAVMARPDCRPSEIGQWLHLGGVDRPDGDRVWEDLFAPWAEPMLEKSLALVGRIANRKHKVFLKDHESRKQKTTAQLARWLRVKADTLCGVPISPASDLFGEGQGGPEWRHQTDPLLRLASFATHLDTPPSKRREANDALETFHRLDAAGEIGPSVMSRPLGMLMLVPSNV